jgi:hypothetical protein
MKILGFFLTTAGWLIMLAALVLLSTETARSIFAAAGIAVQITGLVLVIRSHPAPRGFEY